MNGSGISYRLRPNKYVDRELFAELIALLVTETGADKFIYISMGGRHLVDHLAIYRRAGITKLYAFDSDRDVTDRQQFNAPFDGVRCENHPSVELPARLTDIVDGADVDNAIVWLDFTEPRQYEQLQEVEALVTKLQVGDVLRVTMNIDFHGLDKREAELRNGHKMLPREQKLASLLSLALKTYMPRDIKSLKRNEIPVAVAKSIGRACDRGAVAGGDRVSPVPILLTVYRDSTLMLTATVVMTNDGRLPSALQGWKYASSDWSNIEHITTPDLSPRERYALDKQMHMKDVGIERQFGFRFDSGAIEAYRRFHRFYPLFQPIAE